MRIALITILVVFLSQFGRSQFDSISVSSSGLGSYQINEVVHWYEFDPINFPGQYIDEFTYTNVTSQNWTFDHYFHFPMSPNGLSSQQYCTDEVYKRKRFLRIISSAGFSSWVDTVWIHTDTRNTNATFQHCSPCVLGGNYVNVNIDIDADEAEAEVINPQPLGYCADDTIKILPPIWDHRGNRLVNFWDFYMGNLYDMEYSTDLVTWYELPNAYWKQTSLTIPGNVYNGLNGQNYPVQDDDSLSVALADVSANVAPGQNFYVRIKMAQIHSKTTSEECKYDIVLPAFTFLPQSPDSTDVVIVPPLCRDSTNGQIQITDVWEGGVSDQNSQYTYTLRDQDTIQVWNIPATSSSDYPVTFSGLAPGDYFLSIENVHFCTTAEVQYTVPNPAQFTSSFSGIINNNCFGDNQGSVQLSSTNGTPPYAYTLYDSGGSVYGLINSTNSSVTMSLLPADTYSATVDDANNCPAIPDSLSNIVITEPTKLQGFVLSISDVSCFNESNGGFDLFATGGTGALEYSSNAGASWQPSNSFTGLTAGVYNISIRDANLCQWDSTVTVMEPSTAVAIDVVSTSHAGCFGEASGELVLDGIGGSPMTGGSYRFYLDGFQGDPDMDKTGVPSVTLTNIPAGTYDVYVEDDSACTSQQSVTINQPAQLDLTMLNQIPPSCPGASDGSIQVQAIGGTPPYEFSTDGVVWETDSILTFTATSLAQGSHTFYIRDANFSGNTSYCYNIQSYSLNDPPSLAASMVVTDVDCFGNSTGSIVSNITGGTGSVSNYTFEWRINGQSTVIDSNEDLISYPAGDYELTVFDENACSMTFPFETISEPTELIFTSIFTTTATCSGHNDGDITMAGSGGTGALEFSIDATNFFPTSTFLSLLPGNYTCTIQDANGCLIDSTVLVDSVVVEQYYTIDSIDCAGGTGTITVNSLYGSLPYSYHYFNGSWNTQGLNIISGLSTGNYQLVTVDNNNCPSDTATVVLTEPSILSGITSLDAQDQCALNIGMASISSSGGTPPYSENWFDSNLQTINPLSLETGWAYVEVTDSKGCTYLDSVNVTSLPNPSLAINVVDTSHCSMSDGSLWVDVIANGNAPYSYLWDDVSAQTNDTAVSLTAGTYSVTVTDNIGCVVSESYSLVDGTPVSTSMVHFINSTCGNADGELGVSISGGVAPYSVQWNDPGMQTTDTAFAIASGLYTITVTDDVGCSYPFVYSMTDLSAPTIDSVVLYKSYCNLPTGAAKVYATGGTQPYDFEWQDNLGTNLGVLVDTISGLAANNYFVQVTDQGGCIVSAPFAIEDDTLLTPTLSFVSLDSSACGKPIGEITVQMTGGDMPYSFLWSSSINDTLPTVDSLFAGTYNVIAEDNKGCQETMSFSIVDKVTPSLNLVNITPADCGVNNGASTVSVNNGKAPYTFVWNDPALQTTATANSLNAGTYQVYAIDADSCYSDTLTIVVNTNNPIIITQTDFVSPSCHDSNDGEVEISISGGVSPYFSNWSTGETDTMRVYNLPAGLHYVIVNDGFGCEDSLSFVVTAPNQLMVNNILLTEPSCAGNCDGQIQISTSGGSAPVNTSWDNGTPGLLNTALCTGNHQVTLTDNNGCTSDSTLFLGEPAPITSIGVPDSNTICVGQIFEIDLSAQYNSSTWGGDNGYSATGEIVALDQAGQYWVNTFTNAGCEVNDTFNIATSNDLLQANFVVPSATIISDTVVAVDVTWPLPETNQWIYIDSVTDIIDSSMSDRIEFSFNQVGTFPITLYTTLAQCSDSITKHIEVYADSAQFNQGQRPVDNIDKILEVLLYPNPNNGIFTVTVELDTIETVVLSVHDILNGSTYDTQTQSGQDDYTFSFNLLNLNPGVYIVRLYAFGEYRMFKFIITN